MNTSQLQQHAYALLEQNYQHNEWLVKFSANEGFAHIGDSRGIETIVEGLQHSSALIRERAVKAISALQDTSLSDLVIPLATSDSDPHVRGHAIATLAQLDYDSHFTTITQALSDEHDFVKKCAVDALCLNYNEQSHDELKLLAFGEQDIYMPYPLRLEAAYHLAFEHPIGYDALYEMLESRDEWVQFLAAKKLALLQDEKALPFLNSMVANGDWESKLSAIDSLIHMDEYSIGDATLLKPTHSPDLKTKISAALVLSSILPEPARDVVKFAMNSEEEELQLHVIEEIVNYGHYHLLAYTKDLLQNGRENVRATAVMAIEKSQREDFALLLEPVLLRSHWMLSLSTAKTILKILYKEDCNGS